MRLKELRIGMCPWAVPAGMRQEKVFAWGLGDTVRGLAGSHCCEPSTKNHKISDEPEGREPPFLKDARLVFFYSDNSPWFKVWFSTLVLTVFSQIQCLSI